MSKEELLNKVIELSKTHTNFTIPQTTGSNSWKGMLLKSGIFCEGDMFYEGEFIKYQDIPEEILETIVEEAKFK